ncbi:MAG: hypothetical protein QGI68_01835 [Pseudomonadales bacterium]|jgi:hypothetical protein|nr:hypothetical protein [Pseudomonadales bacterium]MDP7145690.1 hypothetical protein [Pseudomonadales bacterium]MDP7360826.1 hypothetical protein [Pseudomonadales bacterium]MDP7594294.1 hypothetical protein [Pseudomonadales bacterium]HJN51993.1 hypothetical protein [Pseudomonadales bacterium]|tara:strand:+ start:229 stop:411 length:183 start_codon:yes stop_codon:yes gene_type:complete
MIGVIIFILSIELISTAFIYMIAYKRRADCAYWLKMGLLLGPLAVPFVFFSREHGRLNNY